MIEPPAEYGPLRRYTVCIVCTGPITSGGDEPVCTDRCWVEVRHHLRVDELPDQMARNEQIRLLAKRGCRLTWIGAWYGLAQGTVKNLVLGIHPPARAKRSSNAKPRAGWLDKPAPGTAPTLPSVTGPARKHIRCAVCTGPVETPEGATGAIQPICSETCHEILAQRLEVHRIPDGQTRDEEIAILVTVGKNVRDIAAWYNLSPTRIRLIARAEAPDAAMPNDRGSASTSRGRGWLDR